MPQVHRRAAQVHALAVAEIKVVVGDRVGGGGARIRIAGAAVERNRERRLAAFSVRREAVHDRRLVRPAELVARHGEAAGVAQPIGHLIDRAGDHAAGGDGHGGNETGDHITGYEAQVAGLHDDDRPVERRHIAAAGFGRFLRTGRHKAAVAGAGVARARRVRLESRRGAVPGHAHRFVALAGAVGDSHRDIPGRLGGLRRDSRIGVDGKDQLDHAIGRERLREPEGSQVHPRAGAAGRRGAAGADRIGQQGKAWERADAFGPDWRGDCQVRFVAECAGQRHRAVGFDDVIQVGNRVTRGGVFVLRLGVRRAADKGVGSAGRRAAVHVVIDDQHSAVVRRLPSQLGRNGVARGRRGMPAILVEQAGAFRADRLRTDRPGVADARVGVVDVVECDEQGFAADLARHAHAGALVVSRLRA